MPVETSTRKRGVTRHRLRLCRLHTSTGPANETSQISAFSTEMFPLLASSSQRDGLREIEGDEPRVVEVGDLTEDPDTQVVALVSLALRLERGVTTTMWRPVSAADALVRSSSPRPCFTNVGVLYVPLQQGRAPREQIALRKRETD